MRTMIAAVLVLGLAVGGLFLVHELRRAPARPNDAVGTRTKPLTPMDRLQSGVTLDWSADYGPEARARRRAEEILRREELRQNPREGRN
jgi:hypothetical protein